MRATIPVQTFESGHISSGIWHSASASNRRVLARTRSVANALDMQLRMRPTRWWTGSFTRVSAGVKPKLRAVDRLPRTARGDIQFRTPDAHPDHPILGAPRYLFEGNRGPLWTVIAHKSATSATLMP